ncbi:MAG TPA: hypothetical protein VM368_01545 [Flavisolibacter sp.]|nr:hypothetical protein [Flavisolibacter sp.]
MIKISDLTEGAIVNVLFDNEHRQGTVVRTDKEENLVCVNNGIQDFWYPPEEITPIPMTEERLVNLLGFEKEDTPEGTKFKKGAFRVLVHDPGNYTNVDVWYREDHRHFNTPLYLHELQKHHLEMTKVHLEMLRTH